MSEFPGAAKRRNNVRFLQVPEKLSNSRIQVHAVDETSVSFSLALVENISFSNNQSEMREQIRMGHLQCPQCMFHLNGNTMGGKLFTKISNIKYEGNPVRESSAVPSAHKDKR